MSEVPALRVLVIILAVVVAACASQAPSSTEKVAVAAGVHLALPAPDSLGQKVDVAQFLTARHERDLFVFEGRLIVEAGRLVLVGMDLLGRRAMTIRWTAGRMEVERAPWLPDALRPENVLADIILLYWPEESVRAGLSGAGLVAGNGFRSVRRGDEDVITMTYDGAPWSGVAKLVNRERRYEIEVRSQALHP